MTTCATLLIVIFGFYLGIDGEVNFSLLGTSAGVISSIFVSLNGIFTSKVLSKVNDDKSLLLFYNNVNAMFLFLPLIAFFEKEVSVAYLCTCVSRFNIALFVHCRLLLQTATSLSLRRFGLS